VVVDAVVEQVGGVLVGWISPPAAGGSPEPAFPPVGISGQRTFYPRFFSFLGLVPEENRAELRGCRRAFPRTSVFTSAHGPGWPRCVFSCPQHSRRNKTITNRAGG